MGRSRRWTAIVKAREPFLAPVLQGRLELHAGCEDKQAPEDSTRHRVEVEDVGGCHLLGSGLTCPRWLLAL